MDGLAQGKDAIPQYAGTKQKIANVLVEMDDGKPVRIGRADGAFLTFDDDGQVHKDLIASGFTAMETYRALERAERSTTTGKLLDLSPKLNREKWERENRWTLSKEKRAEPGAFGRSQSRVSKRNNTRNCHLFPNFLRACSYAACANSGLCLGHEPWHCPRTDSWLLRNSVRDEHSVRRKAKSSARQTAPCFCINQDTSNVSAQREAGRS
jgi:hypothetical protein